MKSTGAVMGFADSFEEAFAKGSKAAGSVLPKSGKAFLSVRECDKQGVVGLARDLVKAGFSLLATGGTASAIEAEGIVVERS